MCMHAPQRVSLLESQGDVLGVGQIEEQNITACCQYALIKEGGQLEGGEGGRGRGW